MTKYYDEETGEIDKNIEKIEPTQDIHFPSPIEDTFEKAKIRRDNQLNVCENTKCEDYDESFRSHCFLRNMRSVKNCKKFSGITYALYIALEKQFTIDMDIIGESLLTDHNNYYVNEGSK